MRLNDITSYIQRGKSPKYSNIPIYPVIAQKCNQWSGFSIDLARFIDPETVHSYQKERLLRDGDLMWNSTGLGTLGRLAIYYENKNPYGWAVADSHVTVIRVLTEFINYHFIYNFLSSPIVQSVIEEKASGSTKQKELLTKTIKEYLIPLPPLAEQQRIVEAIESALEKVDEYAESYNRLEQLDKEFPDKLKKSILQYAMQGKLVEQDPNDESVEVLLEKIRAEKQKLFEEGKIKKKDLEIPIVSQGDDNSYYEEVPYEIPKSWEWVRLNDISSYIQRGKSPKYSNIPIYPVISQKCNQWSGFSIDLARFIDPETVHSYQKERLLRDGDLMWNSTGLGTLGRLAIYYENKNPYGWAVADSHVTVIRVLTEFINYHFIYNFLSSPIVQSVIEEKASGSTKQKELLTKTIKEYLIPLPPLPEQSRIVDKIEKSFAIIDALI